MKKFLSIIVMAFIAVVLNAQTTTNYAGSSRFFDNWSIGVNGGVQTNLYDWNAPQGAVAGITLNKQLTPLFGFTLEGNTGINNLRNWIHDGSHVCNSVVFDQITAFADGRFNLTNAIYGYTGTPYVLDFEALAGFGYGHVYNTDVLPHDMLLTKLGLNINLNLGKTKAWTLYAQPAVIYNINGGQFDCRKAVAQLTVGLVYHFKTSNKTHHIAASPVPALLEENAALQARVDELTKKTNVAPVTNAVAQVKEVIREVRVGVENTYIVNFAQNDAELSDEAKAGLDKIEAGSTVAVKAYASPEGTEAYNKTLSQKRADAVKDYLAGRKVTVSSADGLGVNGKTSNRVAIVTIK